MCKVKPPAKYMTLIKPIKYATKPWQTWAATQNFNVELS